MAESKPAPKKKAAAKKPAEAAVSRAEFNELKDGLNALVNILTKESEAKAEAAATVAAAPKAEETPLEKEVSKAGPAFIEQINPEWQEVAENIIGAEKIKRLEVKHLRSGGLIFTVVINEKYSNAADDYLKMYVEDKRSREIGSEGIGGVENWCKLISQNLKRQKAFPSVS